MTWTPDPSSLAIPRSTSHQEASSWDNGVHCSGTFLSGTERLRLYMKSNFPLIYETGGYDCRRNTANLSQMSVHGTGRAIDLMIRRIDGQADRRADAIANWLLRHADALGLQLIIWDRTIWNNERPSVVRPYTASSHDNHLHIELNEAGARERTPFFTQGMDRIPASELDRGKGNPESDVLMYVAVAAGLYWLLKD